MVNAGIYLVTTYQGKLADLVGVSSQTTAKSILLYIKSFSQKIRPISLTIVSTILGLLPFLSDGPEEVFWFDFAIGTIAGMVFSVIAIIFVFPVFCVSKK